MTEVSGECRLREIDDSSVVCRALALDRMWVVLSVRPNRMCFRVLVMLLITSVRSVLRMVWNDLLDSGWRLMILRASDPVCSGRNCYVEDRRALALSLVVRLRAVV